MTCGTLVLWEDRRRRGSGKTYRKAVAHYYPGQPKESIPAKVLPHLVVCLGRIIATVEAVNEPEWGGTSPRLEITYKCAECGATTFPHLPDSETKLSAALTEWVAGGGVNNMATFRLHEQVVVNTGGEDTFGSIMDDRPTLPALQNCYRVAFPNGTSQWIDAKYLRPAAEDTKGASALPETPPTS